jgi:type IV secretory pathway VirB10-like protein
MQEAHMKIANLIVTGLMLAGGTLSAHAQILKCVGKDGRIEFAQNCPPGTKQQDAGVRSSPAPAPAAKSDVKSDAKVDAKADAKGAAPKSLADRDAEFRKRQAEQKEADSKSAQAKAEETERQRVCQAAQSNLRALKDRQRMYRSDPKTGERVVFEEADYVREQGVAERVAAENCKG